jgi:ATP-binding cassette subfamily F protein uup
VSILSTEQLGHAFNDRWLFKQLHLGLQKGDRVALVGLNGSGKSTLLSLLAGRYEPLEGKIVKEKGIRIGFLPQDPDFTGFNKITDFIFNEDNIQQQLIRRYEELVSDPNASQSELEKVTDDLSTHNAWEYEYQIKTILNRLQIVHFDQAIDTLSGGQRKRLSLAKLLIDDPDVYVLDEPTNHLDIETIEWLEKLLTTGQKTVLLVTHDRYFLDAVCTEIKELDRGILYSYKGNYPYFLEQKSAREEITQTMVERSRNLMRKELEWMRRQPKARGTKSKARIDAFYDLEEVSKTKLTQEKVQLSMKTTRLGNKIAELNEVCKSFQNQPVIQNFSYIFKKGDRIGLAGKNGTGKSTFLNLITGELSPDKGTIDVGENTIYGYYKQGGLEVEEGARVIDVVKNVAEYVTMADGSTLTASQLLTHFLFPPDKQFGVVSKLSGGERKRLLLMRILMKNPNFLILDEPSNDLDIDTLNVLEEFLEGFGGILILVSHDRYLIDRLTDQLFIFGGENGSVNIYNGNYADYKSAKDQELKELKEKEKLKNTPSAPAPVVQEKKKKRSFKEQKEYETLIVEIPQLEEKISAKSDELNHISDHAQLQELSAEIEKLNAQLDQHTERWIALEELG